MRNIFAAGALALAGLAGIGHNMPPAPFPPVPFAEQMQVEHRIKRRENKKLWQRVRRQPKRRARFHRLSWSQRKGRLFKGHRP